MPAQRKILFVFLISAVIFLFSPKMAFARVVINEFQIEPSSNQWVEIYNNGEETVDVGSWIIDDSGGTEKYIIAEDTVVSSHGFKSFTSGKFNLNETTTDTVKLFDKEGNLVDSKDYPQSPGERLSIGRLPDGGDSWVTFSDPTPDGSNNNSLPQPSNTPSPFPTQTLTPSPIPTLTPKPTSTPKPTATPKPPTPTKTPSLSPTARPNPTATKTAVSQSTEVAKVGGASAVLGETNINFPSFLATESATLSSIFETPSSNKEATASNRGGFFSKIFLIFGALAILGMSVSLFGIYRKRQI